MDVNYDNDCDDPDGDYGSGDSDYDDKHLVSTGNQCSIVYYSHPTIPVLNVDEKIAAAAFTSSDIEDSFL